MTGQSQPRTTNSSDAFARRVEAAVPEALALLPRYGWSERSARMLVERVLATADQAVPMSPEHEWHRQYLQREAAEGRAERAEAQLARLRAVEEALRRVEQLTRPRLDLTQLHELARSALSEPAAPLLTDEGDRGWKPSDKPTPFLLRIADHLYRECERAILAGRLDARSRIGDATLDYRDERDEAAKRSALSEPAAEGSGEA